jgi:hypothetical protein
MQWPLWLVEHRQQSVLLGQGLGEPMIERLIACGCAEEGAKRNPQPVSFCG